MADACIINQDIEPSFESGDLLYGSVHLGLFGNVKRLYPRAPSCFPNLTGNSPRCIFSHVSKHDMRALLREEPRDRFSDARAGSRHKGDFLLQAKHSSHLPFFHQSL